MESKDKDIIKAAQALRDLCKSRKNCTTVSGEKSDCPLMGDCAEPVIPGEWDLPELEEPQEPEVLRELKELKLKEIKTIAHNIDYEHKFDREVNAALAEGWTLVKREVLIPRAVGAMMALYAELERYVYD